MNEYDKNYIEETKKIFFKKLSQITPDNLNNIHRDEGVIGITQKNLDNQQLMNKIEQPIPGNQSPLSYREINDGTTERVTPVLGPTEQNAFNDAQIAGETNSLNFDPTVTTEGALSGITPGNSSPNAGSELYQTVNNEQSIKTKYMVTRNPKRKIDNSPRYGPSISKNKKGK